MMIGTRGKRGETERDRRPRQRTRPALAESRDRPRHRYRRRPRRHERLHLPYASCCQTRRTRYRRADFSRHVPRVGSSEIVEGIQPRLHHVSFKADQLEMTRTLMELRAVYCLLTVDEFQLIVSLFPARRAHLRDDAFCQILQQQLILLAEVPRLAVDHAQGTDNRGLRSVPHDKRCTSVESDRPVALIHQWIASESPIFLCVRHDHALLPGTNDGV